MSHGGQSTVRLIVSALDADASAAGITGLTVTHEALSAEELPGTDLPHLSLVQIDYDAAPLDWRQEARTWTIRGTLWIDTTVADTAGQVSLVTSLRQTIQTMIESIADQVEDDPTLGGIVDHATVATHVPETHSDSERAAALLIVLAEKVV